jgi:hypothetical protein
MSNTARAFAHLVSAVLDTVPVVDLAEIEHNDRTATLNPVIRTVVLTTTEHDQLSINAATATGQESAGLLPDDPSRLRAHS